MKPLSIAMQAFGPYLHEAAVDFTRLGDSRLFLISGSTGGGKTTLLDAMSFALYCRATGGRRGFADMRNIAAPDDLPTRVDFVFLLRGETYRFTRSLRIHTVRGTDRREYREEHACYQREGEGWNLLLSGAEARVREKAQELLGLTCEQFTQVMVLPQGEFRKLLLSSTSEKAKIFQTLFGTERWQKLVSAAQSMANDLKKQADELRIGAETILKREEVSDLDALLQKQQAEQKRSEEAAAWSAACEKELRRAGEILQSARVLSERFALLDRRAGEARSLEARREEMEALRARHRRGSLLLRLSPYRRAALETKQNLLNKEKALEEARARAASASAALETARGAAGEIPALKDRAADCRARAALLEQTGHRAERLMMYEGKIAQCRAGVLELEAQEKAAAEAAALASDRLTKGREYLEKLDAQAGAVAALSVEVQNLRAAREGYDGLHTRGQELQSALAALEAARREEEQARVRLAALTAELERAEGALRADFSAYLSGTLRPGEPCPVCGSREHPIPARPKDAPPPEKEAAILRGQVGKERESHALLQTALARCTAREETARAAFAEQENRCSAFAPEAEVAERLPQRQRELDVALALQAKRPAAAARVEQRRKEEEAALSLLQSCKEKREALARTLAQALAGAEEVSENLTVEDRDLASVRRRHQAALEEAAALEARAQTLEKTLSSTGREQAAAAEALRAACAAKEEAFAQERAAQAALEREKAAAGWPAEENLEPAPAQEALRAWEEEIKRYDAALEAVFREKRALEEELADRKPPELPPLEEAEQTAREKSREAFERSGSLRQLCEAISRSVAELQRLEAQGGDLQKAYSAAGRVAQLISGGNSAKVPLPMFVLGIMLDDILTCANAYFGTFSGGRYSLARKTASGASRGYAGLDLEVFDAHHGGVRSVDTLSGGELFLASLSLAFGLSDVVQSYSGGVRLDSIFIDEGFGSLDQDTLDTAMTALYRIQQMGRTVGIISHVSELKSRIPAQILVRSSQEGSSVRILSAD